MIFSSLALLFFPVLMAYAASSDLLTMRIANWLVLPLVVGLLRHGAGRQDAARADRHSSLGRAAIVLVIAFAFFAFGWIGGGDAKLAAATTLWIGSA